MEPSPKEDKVIVPAAIGTIPKSSKMKKWNLKKPTDQKREDTYKKSHDDYEKSRKEEQIEKYKNQINNLTQVSDKYRQHYQQEKNILLFSLYEKQYSLHTKMVHLKSQKEITENLTKENENL